jgi:hypothetical protein
LVKWRILMRGAFCAIHPARAYSKVYLFCQIHPLCPGFSIPHRTLHNYIVKYLPEHTIHTKIFHPSCSLPPLTQVSVYCSFFSSSCVVFEMTKVIIMHMRQLQEPSDRCEILPQEDSERHRVTPANSTSTLTRPTTYWAAESALNSANIKRMDVSMPPESDWLFASLCTRIH